jgi:predicted nucleic-acid-binding protein
LPSTPTDSKSRTKWKALKASRKGTVGFADHLISEISFASGASELITFDQAFARLPRIRRLQ